MVKGNVGCAMSRPDGEGKLLQHFPTHDDDDDSSPNNASTIPAGNLGYSRTILVKNDGPVDSRG